MGYSLLITPTDKISENWSYSSMARGNYLDKRIVYISWIHVSTLDAKHTLQRFDCLHWIDEYKSFVWKTLSNTLKCDGWMQGEGSIMNIYSKPGDYWVNVLQIPSLDFSAPSRRLFFPTWAGTQNRPPGCQAETKHRLGRLEELSWYGWCTYCADEKSYHDKEWCIQEH